MAIYLGIDPSLRHTGLVLTKDGLSPQFEEIKTENLNVLDSGSYIARCLREFLGPAHLIDAKEWVVGMERQVPGNGMLYYVQMRVLESLIYYRPFQRFVLPLPIQLKSFMIKQMKLNTATKTSIVHSVYQSYLPGMGRLSQHKVEAYCLALMAQAVYERKWQLRLPEKETPLIPPEWALGERNGVTGSTGD